VKASKERKLKIEAVVSAENEGRILVLQKCQHFWHKISFELKFAFSAGRKNIWNYSIPSLTHSEMHSSSRLSSPYTAPFCRQFDLYMYCVCQHFQFFIFFCFYSFPSPPSDDE